MGGRLKSKNLSQNVDVAVGGELGVISKRGGVKGKRDTSSGGKERLPSCSKGQIDQLGSVPEETSFDGEEPLRHP